MDAGAAETLLRDVVREAAPLSAYARERRERRLGDLAAWLAVEGQELAETIALPVEAVEAVEVKAVDEAGDEEAGAEEAGAEEAGAAVAGEAAAAATEAAATVEAEVAEVTEMLVVVEEAAVAEASEEAEVARVGPPLPADSAASSEVSEALARGESMQQRWRQGQGSGTDRESGRVERIERMREAPKSIQEDDEDNMSDCSGDNTDG